jgi:hypothetical protein
VSVAASCVKGFCPSGAPPSVGTLFPALISLHHWGVAHARKPGGAISPRDVVARRDKRSCDLLRPRELAPGLGIIYQALGRDTSPCLAATRRRESTCLTVAAMLSVYPESCLITPRHPTRRTPAVAPEKPAGRLRP